MKHYIVYNSDGQIIRTGTCQDTDFYIQAKLGEHIIEGQCRDDSNYQVIDGELIYTPKILTKDEILLKIRQKRDKMLAQSDWTQVLDAPLTKVQKDKYKAYRQALRDLLQKYDSIRSINEVVFPQIGDF